MSLIAAVVPRAPLPLSGAVGRWCPAPAVCLDELLRWLAAGNSTLELSHAGRYVMPGTSWGTGPHTRGVSNPASRWDLVGGALQKALGIPGTLLRVVLQQNSETLEFHLPQSNDGEDAAVLWPPAGRVMVWPAFLPAL